MIVLFIQPSTRPIALPAGELVAIQAEAGSQSKEF